MSHFLCGCFTFKGDDRELRGAIDELRVLAKANGFYFQSEITGALGPTVVDILDAAHEGSRPRGRYCFLAADDEMVNVSDRLIDASERLVGTDISMRQAAVDALGPLQSFMQAATKLTWFTSPVLVFSEGFDTSYPEIEVDTHNMLDRIAAEYEREDRVPSLKVRIVSR